MATTTIRASVGHRAVPSLTRRAEHLAFAIEVVELTAVAVLAAIVGALVSAAMLAVVVALTTGSLEVAAHVLVLSVPFLAVTMPTMAIWLIGGAGTRHTIRRLRGHQ